MASLAAGKFVNSHKAEKAVFEYIEMIYNAKHMHSALDHLTPKNFEHRYT